MIANFSDELIIPKATVVNIAEEVTEKVIDRINARDSTRPQPSNHQRKEKNKTLYKKQLQGKLDHLSEKDKQAIEPVLIKYTHVFHDEHTNDFKGTDVIEHQILVEDTRPIRKPQYRVPYSLRKEKQTQVEKMLQKGDTREQFSLVRTGIART
jgi:homoaconitase/3-isopropylmalate dehydratase large subunit